MVFPFLDPPPPFPRIHFVYTLRYKEKQKSKRRYYFVVLNWTHLYTEKSKFERVLDLKQTYTMFDEKRTDVFAVVFSGMVSANRYMTVLFLPISHSHSLPLLLSLFYSLLVERNCDREGMEDEVRAAPPRRINRDRETRPLSHPPRFLALLSSLSSLIPSGALPRGPFLRLLIRASTSPHSLPLALPRRYPVIKPGNGNNKMWKIAKFLNIVYHILLLLPTLINIYSMFLYACVSLFLDRRIDYE